MKKEFNLSEKMWHMGIMVKGLYIQDKDVKEAVRKLKELATKKVFDTATTKGRNVFYKEIDEIFGDKLTKENFLNQSKNISKEKNND